MKTLKQIAQIISVFILILIVSGGIYLAIAKYANLWPFNKSWQAVSLTTGEVYFGHLIWLPSPHLVDVWYIKTTTRNGQTNQELFPLAGLYWGPENVLHLKSKNISWWTNLRKDSQVIKAIQSFKNQIPAQNTPQQSLQNNLPPKNQTSTNQ